MPKLRHSCPRVRRWFGRLTGPEASQVINAGPAAPGQARQFTREALARWGLDAANGDACLVVSELITNATRASEEAGQPTVLIRLLYIGGVVVVEAGDHGPGRPPRYFSVPADPGACHGRGLPIVHGLAGATGWYRRDRWKIVWASVRVPAVPEPAPAHGVCRQASVAA